MPLWIEVTLRTLASAVILFAITKILGKRQISQLSLFEYITGATMGNIASYVSLDIDNYWYIGVIALTVWTIVSVSIEFITLKSKKARDLLDGKGTVLVQNGALIRKNLKKERITLDELMEQLRKKDIYRLADVEFGIMEKSGDMNFLLKKEFQPLTPNALGWKVPREREPITVMQDGNILDPSLRQTGYDEQWLKHQLRSQKVQTEDVFFAQVDATGNLTVQTGDAALPEQAPSKPTENIATLLKQFDNELHMLEQFAPNDKDRLDYRNAREKLHISMRDYRPLQP
ncbi:DUF421 domain-containing protein [Paenibacillus protaetiae]|uniref:DUF421 domain-containing protein n=1 Tax=Paenibacillus protaetiae TaxID=2509456 RepID=A0A4P6EYV4_9BACL|nr:DUF421 domain-containing protein [Paenibacillus protaetiae]QAY68046.1 DUF421 domain-containing protein [Paenibacillus protaetiae]